MFWQNMEPTLYRALLQALLPAILPMVRTDTREEFLIMMQCHRSNVVCACNSSSILSYFPKWFCFSPRNSCIDPGGVTYQCKEVRISVPLLRSILKIPMKISVTDNCMLTGLSCMADSVVVPRDCVLVRVAKIWVDVAKRWNSYNAASKCNAASCNAASKYNAASCNAAKD